MDFDIQIPDVRFPEDLEIPPEVVEYMNRLDGALNYQGVVPPAVPQRSEEDIKREEEEARRKLKEEDKKKQDEALKKKFMENALSQFSFPLNNPEETFFDCKIVSKDCKEFHVHKVVLLARSPVLRAMLSCGLKESQSGVIQAKEISSKAMKFLLNFIYTCQVLPVNITTSIPSPNMNQEGQVVNVEDEVSISEALEVASMYQVEDLLEYFDYNLGPWCTENNATLLLSLANKYSLKKAQTDLKNFILENPQINHAILDEITFTLTI